MADGSIIIDTEIDSGGLKTGLASMGKMAVAGVAAATAAVGALTKAAIDSYGEYEQLVGGIETLFGESAGKMTEYASNAYKTAQISANDYMSLATSFSASLLQSVGGDTKKAAEKANSAIIDMADNANKMGSSMESIQNAYQGFAKQNYTMLDNLKLGYGGTKEEMARLLADAEKISGIKYDLSSYADVVDAIHVIQTEMGIAGTSANEAGSTIQGSMAMTKAAFDNLITGLGDENADIGALIGNLVEAGSAALNNLIPVVTTVINAIPDAISALMPTITEELPKLVSELLPKLLDCATTLLDGLMAGMPTIFATLTEIVLTAINYLVESLPMIAELAVEMVQTFANGLTEAMPTLIPALVEGLTSLTLVILDSLPLLLDCLYQLYEGIAQGILDSLPILISALPEIINGIIGFILGAIPQMIEMYIQLLTSLVDALPTIIHSIVEVIPQIIDGIINAIVSAIPLIVKCGIDLLVSLIDALPDIIIAIVSALPEIISSIIMALLDNIPLLIQAGIDLFLSLIKALPKIIVELVKAIPQIITALVDAFKDGFSKFKDIGSYLIKGLWEGIKDVGSWLWDKVSGFFDGLVDGIKDFFGIHSPSKLFENVIGKNLMLGLAVGIDDESDAAISSMSDAAKAVAGIQFRANTTGLTDAAKTISGIKFKANTTGMFDNIDVGDTVRHLTTVVDEDNSYIAKTAAAKSGLVNTSSSDEENNENPDETDGGRLVLQGDVYLDKQKVGTIIAPEVAKEIDWEGK